MKEKKSDEIVETALSENRKDKIEPRDEHRQVTNVGLETDEKYHESYIMRIGMTVIVSGHRLLPFHILFILDE
jgi:hypothetical protein